MSQGRELHTHGSAPLTVLSEYKLWENHWIRCAQELGQWDTVVEFGKAAGNNPFNSEYTYIHTYIHMYVRTYIQWLC